jgi:glycosyltransferase involved in cell wall biosynthesis
LLDAATCRAFGAPYVLHVHGGLFAEFLDGLSGTRRRLANAALRGAARVVVLSPNWRTRLMQLASRVRLSVIPNALESIRPHDVAFPRGGGILFVGDLSETKRPEDLLVAYAALPADLHRRFPLTIVGGGTALRQRLLVELARRLNVEAHVRFAGGLSHADVQAALARADVFAMPSRAEGMPLAFMEAMAAGAAIVATRVGAIPEMAAAGVEALLVPPRDTHTLASALKMLLTDRELRQRLGNAARQRAVEAFPPQVFRAALATMWSEIARRPTTSLAPVPQLATPRHALR